MNIQYARDYMKQRWPELEQGILKNLGGWKKVNLAAEWAYLYARHVIKGPWPEAEPIIIQNPKATARYVKTVKGPWPYAEKIKSTFILYL